MKWPSRVELRFIALWAPSRSVPALSTGLNDLLGLTQLGLLDAHTLYPLLESNGLNPRWIGPRGLEIQDPLAGTLLLCFEFHEIAIH
ncbi:hypothetical protein [Pseudomonas vanderleydeniana]|uniref:Uncharacterized protein n=1 Tax=Pseudomonas vanderleydeniana TaxID=2745495 RepID=A0A9E6PR28_9PSED|nr:hypothetical protein [Pseudomonas vanderleydeniana]QXI31205.1 hypothetical protein HU752_015285 [Pseudomonas vanderleydeniana]